LRIYKFTWNLRHDVGALAESQETI
jgi:hypothetical protein